MLSFPKHILKTVSDKHNQLLKQKTKLTIDDKLAIHEQAKAGVLLLFEQCKSKAYKMHNGGYMCDMLITPEIAKLLLATNPVHVKNNKKTGAMPNRTLGASTVKEYATQMELGKWQETGDALKFASDGTGLDIQHRLAACVKSGVSFVTAVIFNLPKKTMEAMDIGKSRDDKDYLKMKGFDNSSKFVASIKFAMMYEEASQGTGYAYMKKMKIRTSLLENEEISGFLERIGFGDKGKNTLNNCLLTAMKIRKEYADNPDIITPSKIAVLVYKIADEFGTEIAEAFIKKIYSMLNFVPDDPLSIYRNAIINLKAKGHETSMHGLEFRYLIRAWNQFITGKKVKQLNGRDIEHAVPLILKKDKSIDLCIDKDGVLQRKFI